MKEKKTETKIDKDFILLNKEKVAFYFSKPVCIYAPSMDFHIPVTMSIMVA